MSLYSCKMTIYILSKHNLLKSDHLIIHFLCTRPVGPVVQKKRSWFSIYSSQGVFEIITGHCVKFSTSTSRNELYIFHSTVGGPSKLFFINQLTVLEPLIHLLAQHNPMSDNDLAELLMITQWKLLKSTHLIFSNYWRNSIRMD